MTAATHPAAEDLACFVEGKLNAGRRASVIAHVADCDDCREIVVDTAEYEEEPLAVAEPPRRWWLAVAAAMIVAVAIGGFVWHERRDPLAPLVAAYRQMDTRPVDGRLSDFPYVARAAERSGQPTHDTAEALRLSAVATETLQLPTNTMRARHARGIALLFRGDATRAVAQLRHDVQDSPGRAAYWNDLAVAELAARMDADALASANNALRLDPTFSPAAFNRVLALRALGRRKEAGDALNSYLALDANTAWAAEAKERMRAGGL